MSVGVFPLGPANPGGFAGPGLIQFYGIDELVACLHWSHVGRKGDNAGHPKRVGHTRRDRRNDDSFRTHVSTSSHV
jgi:hypothetical protein